MVKEITTTQIVYGCNTCPYNTYHECPDDKYVRFCNKQERIIRYAILFIRQGFIEESKDGKFPDWCPLKEAELKLKEAGEE